MSPQSTLLTTLPLLLALATAIPTTLNTRDDFPTDQWTCGPGCDRVVFSPEQATCASSKFLKSFSTAVTVAVRPDCDQVIDTICRAADKLAKASQPMTNLVHTVGTCEGHMLFSTPTADPTAVTYDACTQAFQSITESCMLMGDPSVHNSASAGKQFGVRNVMRQLILGNVDVSSENIFSADTSYQHTAPGYLIGPSPSVWGTNLGSQKEASVVLSPPA